MPVKWYEWVALFSLIALFALLAFRRATNARHEARLFGYQTVKILNVQTEKRANVQHPS
jgi:hypothetical protein